MTQLPLAAIRFAALALLLVPCSLAAHDGLYKCRGPASIPVYQDDPCPPGQTLRDFHADPATVSTIPFERAAAPPAPAKALRVARPPAKAAIVKQDKSRPRGEATERMHLREGMSDGEVLARLGPPDLMAGKTGRKMRWTYLPASGDPQTVTLVRFDDGKVVAIERTILR